MAADLRQDGGVAEVVSLLGAVAGCDYFGDGINAFGAKKVRVCGGEVAGEKKLCII